MANKAETAIENDELHLVSAADAAIAERDSEHSHENDAPDLPGGAAAAIADRLLATAPHPRDQDFNWDMTENENVLCPEQMPIAIYTNPYGQAVIRQKADWPHEEEDTWICISKHHLQDVIDRLQNILRED